MGEGSSFLRSHLLCMKQIKKIGSKNLFFIKIKKDVQPRLSSDLDLALFKAPLLSLIFVTYSNVHNQLLISESHRMQMDYIFGLEQVLGQSFLQLQRLI